ncbi:MAG: bifunctional riboflavin kinase/FAD synthetase [Chloroherpetonaceae bacterium]|nr:bifunctional riboflavin kinase/FAD synthetase [Chthonomonadaceae bacterium]MDW8206895.1 bifunctional riboflavin kinase/FAD synthetase [Chloroherpetonaceae bacterium]
MKIFEGLETLTVPFSRATVAIGTFDGVHVGHQALLRTAVEDARAAGRPALALTFDRHPLELIAPERAPEYLTTPQQRNRLIAATGVDGLVIARFDQEFSCLSPEDFIQQVLKRWLGAESVVVGTNFGFGRERAGDVTYLREVQSRFQFVLHAVEPVMVGGSPASSTRVRQLIRAGQIEEAERVLGHPFWLAGTVVRGQQLGRRLGFPTANLALTVRQVVPPDGVYAVIVTLDDGRSFGGACSIGNRPAVPGAGRSIETFLFDFSEEIYDRSLELRFLRKLREEWSFPSLDALQQQIARDVQEARAVVTALYHPEQSS